jgi:hypothetical protein
VPGNAIETRADWKLIGTRGYDDKLLFAVHHRFRIEQSIWKISPEPRSFSGSLFQ